MTFILFLLSIGALAYLLIRTNPTARRLVLALGGMRFAPNNTLSQERKRQIALSAGLSELACAYLDSLATGQDIDELRAQIAGDNQISSPRRAYGAIEYCLSARESSLLALVYGAYALKDERRQREFLRGVTKEDDDYYRELQEMLQKLQKTRSSLGRHGVITDDADILRVGTVAWDAALACFLARCCYDLGYISEQEAWGYIMRADRMARKAFTSWGDFAQSFLLGRAIVTGDMDGGMRKIVDDLLEKKKSPWWQLEW